MVSKIQKRQVSGLKANPATLTLTLPSLFSTTVSDQRGSIGTPRKTTFSMIFF